MITLRTGLPGACKTLSAIEAMAKMQARWEKHPEEARPCFVHNVKDLALPFAPMPVTEWKEGGAKPPVMVPDWSMVPDGSWCLIDEAQDFFPPRSATSAPPPHVAFLNTHRHRGLDLELITQHPKLISEAVRKLVGKHLHFRRLFGGQRAYCYEWDACSDSLSGLKEAVGGYYPYPKKAFAFYKSAEAHTKQKFKLPKWLLIPLVGVVVGAFAIPRAYSTLHNGIVGKGLTTTVAAAASAPGASTPLGVGSAPAPSLAKRVEDMIRPPRVAGCMAIKTRCVCLDDAGTRVPVPEEICRLNSVELGMLVPYDTQARQSVSSPPASLSAEPMQRTSSPGSFGGGGAETARRTIVRGSGPGGMGSS